MFYAELDDGRENSVKIYEKEWKCLFANTDVDRLRDLAVKGELRTSRFRSICWRRLLNVLPSDSSNWLTTIQQARCAYYRIKLKHHNDPHQEDSGPDDPLSQEDNSIWNQYFQDEGLKKIIEQDVVRTFPENQFFRARPLQLTMVEILFCYSREHPDLCYRQGMHEILAPLIFVLFCDHQALLQVGGQLSSDVHDLIKDILNPAYLEEDTYLLFNTIMEIIKDYYNFNDYGMSQSEHLGEAVKTASNPSESQVVQKLYKIRDTILAKCDPKLHQHLLNLDISFTTFGVRWLRLLFGGEFSLVDVLVLWDTIFATSPQDFVLVNYIFVSMLVILRVQLLKSDNTTCFGYLMRYPSIDVMDVVQYALHMFAPMTYALPSAATFLKYQIGGDNLKTNNTVERPDRPSKFVAHSSNYPARRMYNNSTDELIDVCKNRLLQYHSILSNAIPTHNTEVIQALNGMLELYVMLDNRPGVIEMGKDVVRSTTPVQTPVTPDTPEGGPLLPPPASAITMKVFSRSERSTNAQIKGAPTKNPLKQMKR